MKKTNDLPSNEKFKIQYDTSLIETLDNPLLRLMPAELVSLFIKDLLVIPFEQLFSALKQSDVLLSQTILRLAIQRKNKGLPFDIGLGYAQRKCRIIETNRRKKFVRRVFKSAPLFALALIRERYPDYVESMIRTDLKLSKGYKRREKFVKRPSDMGLRVCQIQKLSWRLQYTDPQSKEYNRYCNQIAGYMNGLKTKSPIIIEVKYNNIKMDYFFPWNATENKIKSFVAMANKLTSFDELNQQLNLQNRYGG